MIALAIQCPSCGLRLRHSESLLARVQGRSGTTRCPRCRDRVHFDGTGGELEISFPDLYAHEQETQSAKISRETSPPPRVAEERSSEIVIRPGSAMPPALPAGAFAQPTLPAERLGRELLGRADEDIDASEPVWPLVVPRRMRR